MTTFRASDFNLNRPATLIAAIPAVLGFVPEKSLVLVTIERGEIVCAMRADLAEDLYDCIDHMAEVAASSAPDAVVAVVVDEDGADCRMCADDHEDWADALFEALDCRGIELLGLHVVDVVAAGGRWHCARGGFGSGTIEDPRSSPMAVAAVLGGRRLYPSRAELQAVIAVVDPRRAEGLRALMEQTDAGRLRAADARGDVEHALAMVKAIVDGPPIAIDDMAKLGCALVDPRVRDTLYALAVGRDADAAESLWGLLARELPDRWRVEALVLLAFSAYTRGDGTLAGVSLEAALGIDGSHRMARMLDQALQAGMRPEQIRELGQTGYRLAKQLGVRLPARRGFGKRAG